MTATTDAQKASNNTYMARRYAKRKAAGDCVGCGTKPAAAGLVRCKECLRQSSNRTGLWTRRKRQRAATAVAPPQEPEKQEEPKAPPAPQIWKNLEYDTDSGTAEKCAAAIQESCDLRDAKHSHCPTPAQVQERKNAFLVDRVTNKGTACLRAFLPGSTAIRQLRRFVKGDQGERYEVSAWDPVAGLQFTYGWTNTPGKLIVAIMRSKRFWGARVRDREPSPTEVFKAHLRVIKESTEVTT